ncbi:MAG: PQQ-binding-like beta-propeller repeat protein [Saprospiraceae bacterium]
MPTPPPPPPVTPSLKVVWQYPLSPDTTDVFGAAWHTWQGNVIYTTNFTVPEAQIHCRDAATGELRWKRDDLYTEGWIDRQIVSVADNTIASTGRRKFCIDNNTGQNAWKTDLHPFYGNVRLYSIGEFVYDAQYPNGAPYRESISIVRAHHSAGQWDTLFNLPHDNKYYPGLSSVSLWLNQQGDSILMVPVTMLGDLAIYGANQLRADIYAFNLRTRQIEWSIKDFDTFRSGCPIYPPVISDNRLYINCSKALYCIDLLSGTVVWSRDFPSTWGSDIRYNSLKEYGNTILLVSDHTNLAMAISKTDGSTVWENKEVGSSADELTLFEGILYYTSRATGRLYAIDAATGKTIWNMGSPNRTSKIPASFGSQMLCIDPASRRMFVTDKYFILCVELPEG